MDHAEFEVVFLGDVLQVKWVEGDAVSTDAGTGIEGLEAERFGLGGFDDLPDVDVHLARQQSQLVDEADVDEAVGVFQDFYHLGNPWGAYLVDAVDGLEVEGLSYFDTIFTHGTQYFGGVAGVELFVSGVDALGGVSEPEV